ncbi:AtpZ/AtpI family protein [Christiangramia sp. OXR-203]|uniref:AtpZ/AtpI family protein n=1 Tax=unclassified Christiangramia TaxID=2615027 RepID=UPI002AC9D2A1|nr:AtpZ/AtpI family protein [Christiangramia sp. OXR-203]WPY98766.1 AtpZ/AtpI family protein [Christiangramia sp. OXR-203]|tara:strand:- start:102 stop:317 length:216 start_codon:yes stop_codon:yes gene_type:complete
MKNDQRNKYLGFINIAFQMGLLIAAGVFAGIWLDNKFPNKFSVYTISLSLAGVFISLYLVYREVKNLNEDE